MIPPRRSASANERATRTLESLKGMLDRFAAQRAGQDGQLLATELQEIYDAIVAQAARQGLVHDRQTPTRVPGIVSAQCHSGEVIDMAYRRRLRRRRQLR